MMSSFLTLPSERGRNPDGWISPSCPTKTIPLPSRVPFVCARSDDVRAPSSTDDEVERDDPARQGQPDSHGAEDCLQGDEDDRGECGPENIRARPVAAPRPESDRGYQRDQEGDDRTVAVFDDGGFLIERERVRRAERPVRTAEPRRGDAHDPAYGDEHPGGERRAEPRNLNPRLVLPYG
jgi:hypothetical protein